jgi:hypothetical protein
MCLVVISIRTLTILIEVHLWFSSATLGKCQDNTVTCMIVTIDTFWIDNQIYWTLWYSLWLHFTIHYHTHTSVHSRVFTNPCLVVEASNGRRSPSSEFPNYPWPQLLASHSNSSQWLNLSSSLTDWLDMQGWATKLALALRPLMIYCAWLTD